MASTGSPTGGDQGCAPYFGHGAGKQHFSQSEVAPPCPTECMNPSFSRKLQDDRFMVGSDHFLNIQLLNNPQRTLAYQLAREALLSGGPIPALLYADNGFMAYSSGIYTHSCDT